METLKRFRLYVVRISVLVTVCAAGIAYPFSHTVMQGIALGGVGGTLVFWVIASRVEKLAKATPNQVNFMPIQWTLVRMGIYALVMWKAYTLDPVAGTLAAVGGLYIVHGVMVLLAFTGLDLRQENH